MRVDATSAGQPLQSVAVSRGNVTAQLDHAKLEALWEERQATTGQNLDYPIGPGDVLSISVPDIPQLAQRRVRVSTRGTIELPLLGIVPAAGLSEDGLANQIDLELRKYMYHPQATVFVDEYRNREVAVVGAVSRPGLFLLNSPSETMLEVLTQAGGLTATASDELVLIPSRPGTVSSSDQLAALGRSSRTERQGLIAGEIYPARAESSIEQPGAMAESARLADSTSPDSAKGWSGTDPSAHALSFAGNATNSAAPPFAPPPSAGGGLGSDALRGRGDQRFAAETAAQGRSEIRANRADLNVDAEPPATADAEPPATADAEPPATADEAMRLAGSAQAITINLKASTLAGSGKYINLPMRPGDVVIVPGGGDVMVVGWVEQPGRFQVGSGLTVLGAIGAAGGPMYAANTRNIALIRTTGDGSKITIPINMNRISRGQASDIPVQANDVIDVPYSGMRIGPYIFYSILTKVGIGAPLMPY